MKFKWNPYYRGKVMFEVATEPFFKEPVFQKITKKPLMVATLPPGKYYWRVRSVDPNIGEYWKEVNPKLFTLEIPTGPFRVKLAHPDVFADEDRSQDNKEAYIYKIPRHKDSVAYLIEVDAEGKKSKFKSNLRAVRVEGSFQGVWKYRYKVIDKWGRKSNYSKWGKIVFPIAPNY